MIDYGKYWIRTAAIIERILANPKIKFKGNHYLNTGEILEYPLIGKWNVWEFEIKSRTWLEMRGSLHKFWNNGTNENDFFFTNLFSAIVDLCSFLQVSPYDLTVHNLEFGVNIKPQINASEILREIICYKNVTPIKPMDNEKGFFIEFALGEYYFKVYDKGKQYKTVNTLRIEVKAMNSGFLKFANIVTMADLLNPGNLRLLGRKTDNFFNEIVFDDDSIDTDQLSLPDRKVYQELSNARNWTNNKNKKDSTIRARENRFRTVVGKYGTKKLHSVLSVIINEKWNELLNHNSETLENINTYLKNNESGFCCFSYLNYTKKTDKTLIQRLCLSCGRDISDQDPKSKFCSAKFVGEERAHKCRNDNSNPRNQHNRKLVKIYCNGQTLFPLFPT